MRLRILIQGGRGRAGLGGLTAGERREAVSSLPYVLKHTAVGASLPRLLPDRQTGLLNDSLRS